MSTVKVRITKRCMLNATEVGEPGQVVELAAIDAVGVVGCGRATPLDAVAYAEACARLTAEALAIEKQNPPRAPGATPWTVRAPDAPAWTVLPGDAGYRPRVH